MENDNRFVGLILAAGYSSRMGAFKPLLPIGDMTAIERVAATLKKAGIHNMIGVTGFQRERLSSILASKGIQEAYNRDFKQGMFSSIKAGIRTALDEAAMPDGFFLMLVDCPLIPPEVLALMIEKHKTSPDAFIVPSYHGKNGHPLFIPALYAEEILSYEGEGGLKAIRNSYEDKLIRLEVGTEAVTLDMDTPESYAQILKYDEAQLKQTKIQFAGLEEELKEKRLFLIRHGEIRQHREKIFLGQTDVPLSEKGKEQAERVAEKLKQHEISVARIYTSDLSRTAETAEIIKDRLNQTLRKKEAQGRPYPEIQVIRAPMLREMSLGEWDGQYISEIEKKYPEEYQKRGENLPTYKLGNNSENFYDLQYRAMKGLQHILEQERKAENPCEDVVIVSHGGVINVIQSYLRNRSLDEEIRNHIPNGGMIVIDYLNIKEKRL